MNLKVIELILNILLPLIKSLSIYYIGKSNGKNEKEIEYLKENNKKIKEINKILNEKIKVSNEINNLNTNDVYSEWLRETT
jgi:predicted transglutaminase-like cysteine proteinase